MTTKTRGERRVDEDGLGWTWIGEEDGGDLILEVSDPHVMTSPTGGIYIGRAAKVAYNLDELDKTWQEPWSRDSNYFDSYEDAELAFKEGWVNRNWAIENQFSAETYPELEAQTTKHTVN